MEGNQKQVSLSNHWGSAFREASLFVSDDEIDFRNSIIEAIPRYTLHLDLQNAKSKDRRYLGEVTVEVTLRRPLCDKEDLQLDFAGQEVNNVMAKTSREEWKDVKFRFSKPKIQISGVALKETTTVSLKVNFTNTYSSSDDGLHYSMDSNGFEQVFTQGEVASMHLIFPCIDQVNFRSTFSLSVIHADHWKVISNGAILKQSVYDNADSASVDDDEKKIVQFLTLTQFTSVPAIPCYLFAFCGGDFAEFKGKYQKNVQMNIYCRSKYTNAMELQVKEISEITTTALKFMEEYTAIPLFVSKYDQVFCKHFSGYGMENPGCVVLEEERYLFTQPKSLLKHTTRADIISHEVVHMWFGDYVSLTWWNDLFLKEGFATFFAFKICQQFYGFSADNLVYFELAKLKTLFDETFPPCSEAFSISHSRGNFTDYSNMMYHNEISYQKAASLFQLMEQKLLGEDTFRVKVRLYLEAFAMNSAGVKEFLDIFEKDSEVSIVKKYLFKKGLSYFENGKFVETNDLGLEEKDYRLMNLSVFEINEKDIVRRPYNESSSDSMSLSNIQVLDTCDSHLVFQRLSAVEIQRIGEFGGFAEFPLSLRVSLWKAVLMECIFTEKEGRNAEISQDEFFVDFFINNIISEKNLLVFHFVLRFFNNYRQIPFTEANQGRLRRIYEEIGAVRKTILLKCLHRYFDQEKHLQFLVNEFIANPQVIKKNYIQSIEGKAKLPIERIEALRTALKIRKIE